MGATFEAAADAIVGGDIRSLAEMTRESPQLIRARSNRPHHATLLHYLAANGVEGERQKSPKNAVEIATLLLNSGAEVDALAEMYEGQHTTMAMLVSSVLPAKAGVQDALVERLLDFGAAIEGAGTGESPLIGALAFGYLSAAETLAKRGAKTDTLPAVAGLGRFADAARLLPTSDAIQRHRALALAAQHGHVEIVRLLLDAGEDPNVTIRRVFTVIPPRCIKQSAMAAKARCGCLSSGRRVWTSKTMSIKARRSIGRNTSHKPGWKDTSANTCNVAIRRAIANLHS
jgi:hypothetical protein